MSDFNHGGGIGSPKEMSEFPEGGFDSPKGMSEFPEGVGEWQVECSKLSAENQIMKRCMRLMRDNSALETATLLSAVISFCDKKFRRKFADLLEGEFSSELDTDKEKEYFSGSHVSDMTQTSVVHMVSPAPKAFAKTAAYSPESPGADSYYVPKRPKVRLKDKRHETPERDVPQRGDKGKAVSPYYKGLRMEDLTVEPEQERPRKHKNLKKTCYAICQKSPPVSQGGRQIKSADDNLYLLSSDPTSYHFKSHKHTYTPLETDLEYDTLYLRSLALAAGYRAMAKGLSPEAHEGIRQYKLLDHDKLWKKVAEIPPYIMYRNKPFPKQHKLIHACVSPKPTTCRPFSREGSRAGDEPGKPKSKRTPPGSRDRYSAGTPPGSRDRYSAGTPQGSRDRYSRTPPGSRDRYSAGTPQGSRDRYSRTPPGSRDRYSRTPPGSRDRYSRSPTGSEEKESRAQKPKKPGSKTAQKKEKEQGTVSPDKDEYDFQAAVEPIIEQARLNIQQVTGTEPVSGDLKAYSLHHTHKEYTYSEDGTANVQSDSYKKSYNWSSEEEDEEGGKEGAGGAREAYDPQRDEDRMHEVHGIFSSAEQTMTAVEKHKGQEAEEGAGGKDDDSAGPEEGLEVRRSSSIAREHVHWEPHTQFETHPSEHLPDGAQQPSEEEPVIDIDLNDPEIEQAAVKIQATYRGHLTRRGTKEKIQLTKDFHPRKMSGTSSDENLKPKDEDGDETRRKGEGEEEDGAAEPKAKEEEAEEEVAPAEEEVAPAEEEAARAEEEAARAEEEAAPAEEEPAPAEEELAPAEEEPAPVEEEPAPAEEEPAPVEEEPAPAEEEPAPAEEESAPAEEEPAPAEEEPAPAEEAPPEEVEVAQVVEQAESAEGEAAPAEEEAAAEEGDPPDADKTNNRDSEGQSPDEVWLVTRDIDWANHCSVSSPFRVVTPRALASTARDGRPVIPTKSLHQPQAQESQPEQTLGRVRQQKQPGDPDYSPDGLEWTLPHQALPGKSPGLWSRSSSSSSDDVVFQRSEARLVPVQSGTCDSNNILGEVAFQLERRILDYVFANNPPDIALNCRQAAQRKRFYGYTLNNIGEMINKEAISGEKYSRGTERMLRERLLTMLDLLTPMGYDLMDHGAFSQDVINKYGLLARPPSNGRNSEKAYSGTEVGIPGVHVADVQNFIFSFAGSDHERDNLLLIFDCLRMLAIEDGRPLFVW